MNGDKGSNVSVIIADKSSNQMLLKQEAEWKEKVGEWKEAGDLFMKANELKKAIDIYIKNNYANGLIDACRIADSESQRKEIETCAGFFK